MIASTLYLSRADCKTLGIKDEYSIHKVVYSLFPQASKQESNFLYADKGGNFNERKILLLSQNVPVKPETGRIETKEIPDAFLQGEYYGFEVTMNPVKRDSATKKIIPVKGKDLLAEWFIGKAPNYGFEVLPGSLSIGDTNVIQFEKNRQKVVLGKAVFTGKLKVTDRNLFINSFKNGLGKGKAFGFGLLQIVPIKMTSLNK